MKLHQMTIKDIARILGISASTVSRALKDHPDISTETKEAVRKVAASVNYRPNALALSLRKAKTNIIGVVVPEMSHYFFASVMAGMSETAAASGYTSMMCQSCEDADIERMELQSLMDSRVDGILLSVSKTTNNDAFLKDLIDNGMPVVMFDRIMPGVSASSVTTDDHSGAYNAVSLMTGHGRKRIAILCGDKGLQVSDLRLEGYLAALAEAGIERDDALIIDADTPQKLKERRADFESIAGSIDGLFAINDSTAIEAMKMLGAAGAVEAIFTALSLRDGYLPATINYRTPDPECDLDVIPNQGRKADVRYAMSNSLGFGGHNGSLLLKKWEA